ncbi:MAG: tetratricopeptide repeat protein [Candidatus Omnitrophota bacterium]
MLKLILCAGLVVASSGCVMLQDDVVQALPRYKNPSELYDKALVYYQSGQYAKAKELFHQFIGSYPDSLVFKTALYELAHCYQMLGEDKQALALYNRLVTAYGDRDFWGDQAMQRIRQINGENRL